MSRTYGDRTKLLPYTNFYVEVLTQFRIKLLHVREVLTNFRTCPDLRALCTKMNSKRLKMLRVEVLSGNWLNLLHVEVLSEIGLKFLCRS